MLCNGCLLSMLLTWPLQDDKESLAELHDYITSGEHYPTGDQYDYQFAPSSGGAPQLPPIFDDFPVATSPSKAERRRSLPSRMSISSFVSYTSDISAIVAPTPTEGSFQVEPTFQQRRRRAAKLTHFFGVDYRDLMSEILESIEKSLEEERDKGTLKADEVQVCLSGPLILPLVLMLFSSAGPTAEAGQAKDEAEQPRVVSKRRRRSLRTRTVAHMYIIYISISRRISSRLSWDYRVCCGHVYLCVAHSILWLPR